MSAWAVPGCIIIGLSEASIKTAIINVKVLEETTSLRLNFVTGTYTHRVATTLKTIATATGAKIIFGFRNIFMNIFP